MTYRHSNPASVVAAELFEDADSRINHIVELFRDGLKSHCERYLEVGRLSHELCRDAIARGYNSRGIRQMLSDRLQMVAGDKRIGIGRIISHYWVVQLLGDGNAGTMTIGNIREFHSLIERNWNTEEWSIKEGIEAKAKALFAQARDDHKFRRVELRATIIARFPTVVKFREVPNIGKNGARQKLADNPLKAACDSNAKDLAELVAQLIMGHKDPEAVVTALQRYKEVMTLIKWGK